MHKSVKNENTQHSNAIIYNKHPPSRVLFIMQKGGVIVTINKTRMEDDKGNIYYPHTSADVVFTTDGQSVEEKLQNVVVEVTKEDVGLGNVNNTSDMDKPVSTAQQAAIDGIDVVEKLGFTPASTQQVDDLEQSVNQQVENYNGHTVKIATTTELGHIRPDGETISVDPETGIASSVGSDRKYAKFYNGDLNDLTECGLYSVPENTPNAPNELPLIIEVKVSNDGKFVIQRATYDHLGTSVIPSFTRRAIKDTNGVFVWSKPSLGAVGFVGEWRLVDYMLSDDINDTSTNRAATANAVKQVNDKIEKIATTTGVFAPFENIIGSTLRYKAVGGIVGVSGAIKVLRADSNNTICHLPTEYLPVSDIPYTIRCQRGSTYTNIRGLVNSGGIVMVDTADMSGLVANDILHINFVFTSKF